MATTVSNAKGRKSSCRNTCLARIPSLTPYYYLLWGEGLPFQKTLVRPQQELGTETAERCHPLETHLHVDSFSDGTFRKQGLVEQPWYLNLGPKLRPLMAEVRSRTAVCMQGKCWSRETSQMIVEELDTWLGESEQPCALYQSVQTNISMHGDTTHL